MKLFFKNVKAQHILEMRTSETNIHAKGRTDPDFSFSGKLPNTLLENTISQNCVAVPLKTTDNQ